MRKEERGSMDVVPDFREGRRRTKEEKKEVSTKRVVEQSRRRRTSWV